MEIDWPSWNRGQGARLALPGHLSKTNLQKAEFQGPQALLSPYSHLTLTIPTQPVVLKLKCNIVLENYTCSSNNNDYYRVLPYSTGILVLGARDQKVNKDTELIIIQCDASSNSMLWMGKAGGRSEEGAISSACGSGKLNRSSDKLSLEGCQGLNRKKKRSC